MYEIEKGVEMPSLERAGYKYPLRGLEVGDSFVVPKDKLPKSGSISGCLTPQSQRLGIKIITRKQPDGSYRVWRIE
jgi:hypothetical protein